MDSLILRLLRSQSATICEIANYCRTSEETIRARLKHLEEAGFAFVSHPALGVTLSRTPERLIGDLILAAIPPSRAPQSIAVYSSTRSTNDLAHQAGINHAPSPAVFIAEHQSAGRGRSGRHWSSPKGLGLWMSVLLRISHPQRLWPRLTTVAATIIAHTLGSTLGLPIRIKWPNDLWIDNAKLAGIIAETGSSAQGPYAVLGVGINVLHSISDFPPELQSTATSIKIHSPDVPCRNTIAANLLDALSQVDYAISNEGFKSVVQNARALSCLLHKNIELSSNGERITGHAKDLNAEGHLILLTSDGSERTFHSGEVTHIRPSC
jgi:BirA family transcriptional regulator, biotin operon repressor / biotin---[acetyl-CoA-carboxylase] ligase